jgi:hypothetical protein
MHLFVKLSFVVNSIGELLAGCVGLQLTFRIAFFRKSWGERLTLKLRERQELSEPGLACYEFRRYVVQVTDT